MLNIFAERTDFHARPFLYLHESGCSFARPLMVARHFAARLCRPGRNLHCMLASLLISVGVVFFTLRRPVCLHSYIGLELLVRVCALERVACFISISSIYLLVGISDFSRAVIQNITSLPLSSSTRSVWALLCCLCQQP